MKRNHLMTLPMHCAAVLMGAGALLTASCAVDGFDDEAFETDVRNTTLASPSADDITVTASADGSRTTLAWPVVYGASGYECRVYDVTDPENTKVLLDSIVDGCSVSLSRPDDTNFLFDIRTLANKELGNSDAPEKTSVQFTSILPADFVIPNGANLNEWFAANPIPDSEEQLVYELEAGGTYEMNDIIDFQNHRILLRSAEPKNHATINLFDLPQFRTYSGMVLKNLDIDAYNVAEFKPLIVLSEENTLTPTANGSYYIINDPITIQGCNIWNLAAGLIDDGGVKYAPKTLIISDSKIAFWLADEGSIAIYFRAGFIQDFQIKNSTIWNVQDDTTPPLEYFLRYVGRPNDIDSNKSYSQKVTFNNSTFYNLAKNHQFANYRQSGQSNNAFEVKNCIFVDCGQDGQLMRRLVGGQADSQQKETFLNNTYWFDGHFSDDENAHETTYDTSGTILMTEPFTTIIATQEDFFGSSFVPTGAEQVAKKTGDPRWFE